MTRKIKFALELKDGFNVRKNLDELREHFDMEQIVGYFLNGKLIKWLEDRYYDNEVKELLAINKDDPDLNLKICAALGVEYEGDKAEEVDTERIERINEIKIYLGQRTDDSAIVANADKTALTQEDLADLLDFDERTIYLCGESFDVPVRIVDKNYIGILGTPKISINAKSQLELYAQKIHFENCELPWTYENKSNDEATTKINIEKSKPKILPGKHTPFLPKSQLVELFESCNFYAYEVWQGEIAAGAFSELQKKIIANLLYDNEYSEYELITVGVDRDYDEHTEKFNDIKFNSGFALTVDSLCYFYETENKIIIKEKIKYDEMKSINLIAKKSGFNDVDLLEIITDDGQNHICAGICAHDEFGQEEYNGLLGLHGYDTDNEALTVKKFLDKIIEIKKYI